MRAKRARVLARVLCFVHGTYLVWTAYWEGVIVVCLVCVEVRAHFVHIRGDLIPHRMHAGCGGGKEKREARKSVEWQQQQRGREEEGEEEVEVKGER